MGAQLRVVRRRIRSVQSTMKITRAMELIASSRIVKAQQRVEASRPYAVQLTQAMEDVAAQTGTVSHPLLEQRSDPAKVGVLVVTSDRGLAGSYNSNVLKIAEQQSGSIRARGLEPVLYVAGKKGVGYFRFRGVPIQQDWQGHSEVPGYEMAVEIGRRADRGLRASARSTSSTACTRTSGRRSRCAPPSNGSCRSRRRRSAGDRHGAPRRVPVRARAGGDPRPPAAAVRHHQGVRRAPGVGGIGERRAPSRDEGRDRQRGGAHQGLHQAGQPGPPGRDHHGDQRDRGRGGGPVRRIGRVTMSATTTESEACRRPGPRRRTRGARHRPGGRRRVPADGAAGDQHGAPDRRDAGRRDDDDHVRGRPAHRRQPGPHDRAEAHRRHGARRAGQQHGLADQRAGRRRRPGPRLQRAGRAARHDRGPDPRRRPLADPPRQPAVRRAGAEVA